MVVFLFNLVYWYQTEYISAIFTYKSNIDISYRVWRIRVVSLCKNQLTAKAPRARHRVKDVMDGDGSPGRLDRHLRPGEREPAPGKPARRRTGDGWQHVTSQWLRCTAACAQVRTGPGWKGRGRPSAEQKRCGRRDRSAPRSKRNRVRFPAESAVQRTRRPARKAAALWPASGAPVSWLRGVG